MSGRAVPISPLVAYREGLLAAAEADPALSAVDAGVPPDPSPASFGARFPARYRAFAEEGPEALDAAVERSRGGSPTFLASALSLRLEAVLGSLVRELFVPRRNVKLVGVPSSAGPTAFEDDLGWFRAIPAAIVVAPADAPTVRSATIALAAHGGSGYLRLPEATSPVVTDGTFRLGRAGELRAGDDLTVLALGPMVGLARALADDLAQVGVSVRLLDVASVKPFDEASVLRAARDTGAILVAEPAPLATGLGTLVAAITAENYPVPVRRFGWPDLWPERPGEEGQEPLGLTRERLRDEAWELLRLRGKVS